MVWYVPSVVLVMKELAGVRRHLIAPVPYLVSCGSDTLQPPLFPKTSRRGEDVLSWLQAMETWPEHPWNVTTTLPGPSQDSPGQVPGLCDSTRCNAGSGERLLFPSSSLSLFPFHPPPATGIFPGVLTIRPKTFHMAVLLRAGCGTKVTHTQSNTSAISTCSACRWEALLCSIKQISLCSCTGDNYTLTCICGGVLSASKFPKTLSGL